MQPSGIVEFLKYLGLPAGNLLTIAVSIALTYSLFLPTAAGLLNHVEVYNDLLTAAFVGYLMWVFYIRFFGEYVVFPIAQATHFIFDSALKRLLQRRSRSTFGLLAEAELPWWQLRRAYVCLEREYLPVTGGKQISLAHGENQIMIVVPFFLLIVVTAKVFLIEGYQLDDLDRLYLWVALGMLLISTFDDWRQHALESDSIRSCAAEAPEDIGGPLEFLERRGFSPRGTFQAEATYSTLGRALGGIFSAVFLLALAGLAGAIVFHIAAILVAMR